MMLVLLCIVVVAMTFFSFASIWLKQKGVTSPYHTTESFAIFICRLSTTTAPKKASVPSQPVMSLAKKKDAYVCQAHIMFVSFALDVVMASGDDGGE